MVDAGNPFARFWITPIVFGVVLILLGLLLVDHPELLAYFVAGLFMLAGVTLIGVGWNLRQRVTYRRIERTWPNDDEDAP